MKRPPVSALSLVLPTGAGVFSLARRTLAASGYCAKRFKAGRIFGDPSKSETIVQRVKFPPNYQDPPHTHPYSEIVTVLSGTFGNAMGDKPDESQGEMSPQGSVFALPAKHPHYVWTTDQEVIVQIMFRGPGGIDFVNPADDPRKK